MGWYCEYPHIIQIGTPTFREVKLLVYKVTQLGTNPGCSNSSALDYCTMRDIENNWRCLAWR